MSVRIPIYKLKLVRSHVATYPAAKIGDPATAAEFFRTLIGSADREHLAALYLDSGNVPCGAEIVAIGTLNSAKLHIREIFKGAIVANACSIVTAHNHPSGDITPSAVDLSSARLIVAAGRMLGIHVVDNIIVGSKNTNYASFLEAGIIEPDGGSPEQREAFALASAEVARKRAN